MSDTPNKYRSVREIGPYPVKTEAAQRQWAADQAAFQADKDARRAQKDERRGNRRGVGAGRMTAAVAAAALTGVSLSNPQAVDSKANSALEWVTRPVGDAIASWLPDDAPQTPEQEQLQNTGTVPGAPVDSGVSPEDFARVEADTQG